MEHTNQQINLLEKMKNSLPEANPILLG